MVSIAVIVFVMLVTVETVRRCVEKSESYGVFMLIFVTHLYCILICMPFSLPEQHPCTSLCHAPAVCPEDEPCQASVYVSCSCGRIRQAVQCGKSTSRPNGTSRLQPKCTSECGIAQRNARLADALGIKTDGRTNPGSEVTYNEELVGFARTNMKFLGLVESAFTE